MSKYAATEGKKDIMLDLVTLSYHKICLTVTFLTYKARKVIFIFIFTIPFPDLYLRWC